VVINPATPVATLSEVLAQVDQVLVMSVNPGFGGQQFIPNSLEKIRQLRDLRARNHYKYGIEVDGGVAAENAAELVRAGTDILVAGTSVFHTPDPAGAVKRLQQIALEAMTEKV
jgi:ribulose-phosphate 3-epimerase